MIKLYKGDCLEVMKQIPDKSVDMILCDLPYGTTDCKWDNVIPFEPLWKQYNRIIKDNGAICLFGNEPFSSRLRISNIKNYKYDWIWKRTFASNFLNLKKQPAKKIEFIHIFYKKQPVYNPQMLSGKPYKISKCGNIYPKQQKFGIKQRTVLLNNGYRYPDTIIEFKNPSKNRLHPTQKPVDLLEYLIKTYSNENDVVLDNCMGSGSTGVACKHLNRNFIGIELDDKYFDIAEKRINGELF